MAKKVFFTKVPIAFFKKNILINEKVNYLMKKIMGI